MSKLLTALLVIVVIVILVVLFATTVVVAAAAAVPGEAHGVAIGVQRPVVVELTPHVLALPARASELDDAVDEGRLIVRGSPLLAPRTAAAAAGQKAESSACIVTSCSRIQKSGWW